MTNKKKTSSNEKIKHGFLNMNDKDKKIKIIVTVTADVDEKIRIAAQKYGVTKNGYIVYATLEKVHKEE